MSASVNDMPITADDHAAGPEERALPAIHAWITLEVALYVALAVASLALRFAQLDHAPLNDAEAREALAVLRAIDPDVPGEALVARSPLTQALHLFGFTFLGLGNFAARFPAALGGVLLTLSPLLWRRYVNPLPSLVISLLLTISPVALLAARTSSPVVWTMLLAVVGSWLVLRFVETRAPAWAVAATAVFAAMALLIEPAGLLALVALAFGVWFAWITDDDPETDMGRAIRELWRAWPWANGALAAGFAVLVIGTGFFWLPSGVTAIGNLVWSGAQGFLTRLDGAPLAFPLWVALRYEPGIMLAGLLASYRAVRVGGFFERALAGWALAGVVWSLVYTGADAAYALWLTLPLTILVGLTIVGWLAERAGLVWQVPGWSVPLHGAVTCALWMAIGVSAVLLGKFLLVDLPAEVTDLGALARKLLEGVYSRNSAQGDVVTIQGAPVFAFILGNIQLRLLVTVLVLLLNGVLFFLAGSLWGARAAWRGLALGTLAYLLVFGFGLGGRAAFIAYDDPRELWYVDPVTHDMDELRDTLQEMSLRATGTPHLIGVTVQAPGDGALAWALRSFPNAVFVRGVGSEVSTAAVVMPVTVPQPAMGADYVGKDLILRRMWATDSLSWRDGLMWLYRGDSRLKPVPSEQVMLWVRKDVYGVQQVTED